MFIDPRWDIGVSHKNYVTNSKRYDFLITTKMYNVKKKKKKPSVAAMITKLITKQI